MHIEITDHNVIVVKPEGDERKQISFFNLLSEFYTSKEHNSGQMSRVEIAQQFIYDLLLFVKDDIYEDTIEAEDADYVDFPDERPSIILEHTKGNDNPAFPFGGLPDKIFG